MLVAELPPFAASGAPSSLPVPPHSSLSSSVTRPVRSAAELPSSVRAGCRLLLPASCACSRRELPSVRPLTLPLSRARRPKPLAMALGWRQPIPLGVVARVLAPWPWRVVGGGPCSWVPAAPRVALLPGVGPGLACGGVAEVVELGP